MGQGGFRRHSYSSIYPPKGDRKGCEKNDIFTGVLLWINHLSQTGLDNTSWQSEKLDKLSSVQHA